MLLIDLKIVYSPFCALVLLITKRVPGTKIAKISILLNFFWIETLVYINLIIITNQNGVRYSVANVIFYKSGGSKSIQSIFT